MKYGIYYAYWEQKWVADYIRYVQKAAILGFDILEIQCTGLEEMPECKIRELAAAASDSGVELTAGYGPRADQNLASNDGKVVANGLEFWKRTLNVLARLNIRKVGGGLYSYWPVDYQKPFDKKEDLKRSIDSMRKLGEIAAPLSVNLGMEVLNRFEGYLLNTAAEALAYVQAVGLDNVKIMLDTFHMNIEEDSITGAIRTAGSYLGHFHIGEPNRRPPRAESRLDWAGIGRTLKEIGYSGAAVMEPFVLQGGQVGSDIKVWRDLAPAAETDLDAEAEKSVSFIRKTFESA